MASDQPEAERGREPAPQNGPATAAKGDAPARASGGVEKPSALAATIRSGGRPADHSASSHDWIIRTPDGDQMRASVRVSTSWPLLRMYAVRQVQLRYRQSALGLSWTLVQPIAIMAIYGFIFTQFFEVDGGDAPYLSMAWTGLTIWAFVQVTLQTGTVSLLNDAYMLSRVWFPREIIPLAPVVAGLVDLAAAAAILVPIVIIQGVGFSINVLALPLILYVLLVWVTASCLLASTITIFFRDMATIVGLGLRLLFIATPVMYPASLVPPQFGWVLAANPFAVIVNNTRNVILAHVWPNWDLLALHAVVGTALVVVGLKYLRSVERRMVDII